MTFKACIAIITALCAMQVICEDDEDYGDLGGCPFLVAENKTGYPTIVACKQDCNGTTETAPNGTRCFSIGDEGLRRMTANLPYDCPLGQCSNGDCIPKETYEVCYRRNWRDEKN
uniref:Evasin n=1 Tax=Rhipicephalus sanguineus TaxID=34632 RepID=C9W1N8_RHISA